MSVSDHLESLESQEVMLQGEGRPRQDGWQGGHLDRRQPGLALPRLSGVAQQIVDGEGFLLVLVLVRPD